MKVKLFDKFLFEKVLLLHFRCITRKFKCQMYSKNELETVCMLNVSEGASSVALRRFSCEIDHCAVECCSYPRL